VRPQRAGALRIVPCFLDASGPWSPTGCTCGAEDTPASEAGHFAALLARFDAGESPLSVLEAVQGREDFERALLRAEARAAGLHLAERRLS